MRLVFISDTHCSLNDITIPDGDILIHTGDLTYRGTIPEIIKEFNILDDNVTKFRYVIFVAGNHDFAFERSPSLAQSLCKERNIIYLENSGITIEGINFFGSPITPYFCNWAFNRHRGSEIKKYWDAIPDNTNVLLTHGPPHGILDLCQNGNVGCADLLNRVKELKELKIHAFGHIHSANGIVEQNGVKFINSSIMNDSYNITYKPIIIDL